MSLQSLGAVVTLEAELDGSGSGWTNITQDVNMGVEDIVCEYGIKGGGPMDRVAGIGTLSWAMNNSDHLGRVEGQYTPGHTNARSGWEIGIIVRLSIYFNNVTYYKFRGTLVQIDPDVGIKGRRSVHCVAEDWIGEAVNGFVRDVDVQTAKRGDQLITTVVDASTRRQPAATSYETGQSTFAYALDNVRDERTQTLRVCADITMAEVGYFYIKGDTTQGGTLKWEDRHARPKATLAATFNENMIDMAVSRARDNIYNHINVVVHPRAIDAAATTVLYTIAGTETNPKILAGEVLALTVFFKDAIGRFVRVGGSDLVTPVASTDYVANAQADGGGADMTSDLALVFTSTSNSATFAFTNNHASDTAFLTTLQVRGKAVQDRYDISVFKHDTDSEDSFGERDITYDMVFEDKAEIAGGICDWFLSLYGAIRMVLDRGTIRSSKNATLLLQGLAREPGDKIAVKEAMSGVDTNYFINGVNFTIRAGGIMTTSWVLAPADQQAAWILEDAVAGLLETGTVLGFV